MRKGLIPKICKIREYVQLQEEQWIPSPYINLLNLISNLLTVSDLIKVSYPDLPHVFNNQAKFEEDYRDLNGLLYRFDTMIVAIVMDRLLLDELPLGGNNFFNLVLQIMTEIDGEKLDDPWILDAEKQIQETINTLFLYRDAPEPVGENMTRILSEIFI